VRTVSGFSAGLFTGDVRMQDCSVPLPKVGRPHLMRERDAEWLIEATWAEHDWPSGATRRLRRRLSVLLALAEEPHNGLCVCARCEREWQRRNRPLTRSDEPSEVPPSDDEGTA
jgi:hypothetical protein